MSIVFALATPASKSALCVFRVSGDGCLKVLGSIFGNPPIEPRRFYHSSLISQSGVIDSVGVVFFKGSSGYTGEDGFEISLPNNLAEDIAKKLLFPLTVQVGPKNF